MRGWPKIPSQEIMVGISVSITECCPEIQGMSGGLNIKECNIHGTRPC